MVDFNYLIDRFKIFFKPLTFTVRDCITRKQVEKQIISSSSSLKVLDISSLQSHANKLLMWNCWNLQRCIWIYTSIFSPVCIHALFVHGSILYLCFSMTLRFGYRKIPQIYHQALQDEGPRKRHKKHWTKRETE